MRVIPLQSGSSGNCLYVESGGVRLLFDAGLSAAQVTERLGALSLTPRAASALFISHDHYDHVRCAGVYARAFDVPLYITERTYDASRRAVKPTRKMAVQHFRSGSAVKIGHVTVETIRTPHDAADGVVFVVDDGKHRLGICTDVGHVFDDLKSVVGRVDGLFLESNYDETMLANGPYPARLKARISGSRGHISNREAAELVAASASDRLQWLYLAHLSDKNNTPRKALAAHRAALGEALPIALASRHEATSAMLLGEADGTAGIRRQLAFDF